jgi:hypothetical protein
MVAYIIRFNSQEFSPALDAAGYMQVFYSFFQRYYLGQEIKFLVCFGNLLGPV